MTGFTPSSKLGTSQKLGKRIAPGIGHPRSIRTAQGLRAGFGLFVVSCKHKVLTPPPARVPAHSIALHSTRDPWTSNYGGPYLTLNETLAPSRVQIDLE